ncbi:hypothetical protein [Microbacterium karelineae]|uniref:hypothetical protein n=1 Tax=Microbacterium karelineae TaxID=2654283 RepID=UPI0012EAFA39|nr:hypothetical protein [Microbacterium karelineae]
MTGTTAPTPPAPTGGPQQSPTARSGTRALAVTIGVLGGAALVLSGVGVAFATVGSTIASTLGEAGQAAVSAVGVANVVADVDAGELDIEFGRGDEVSLEHYSDGGAWTLERDGDTVVVSSPDRDFGISFFDWNHRQEATLVLPESLEGVDLDVTMAAGSLTADGEFGAVSYDIDAGHIEVEGSAESIDARMSAGRSVLELDSVSQVFLAITAGSLDADLTGEAPEAVTVHVTAGSAELQLPDVPYDVRVDREAGGFDSSLTESRSSSRTIDGTVTAGSLSLYAD